MAVLQRLALRGTPKATKAAARYTPAGGAERCGMCRHYVPSSSCARIEGPVSAAGWCQLYSQQVTWRPRAGQLAGLNPGLIPPGVTLDLSFMSATMPPSVTFTRASAGTYLDSTGTLRTAAINAPRWDYDPVTHAPRGLLIEEARTNVLFPSVIGGSWGPLGAALGGSVTTPDGATSTTALVGAIDTTNSVRQFYLSGIPVSATTTYTLTTFFKAGPVNAYFQINVTGGTTCVSVAYYDLTAGTAVVGADLAAGLTGRAVSITAVGNGWYRCSFTFTTVAGNTALQVAIGLCTVVSGTGDNRSYVGVVGQGIYAWGVQVEAGAFATSYIATTTAAVTRAQDQCYAAIGAWFNPSTYSLSADFDTAVPTSFYAGIGDSNINNGTWLTNTGFTRAGGGSAAAVGTVTAGASNKMCGTINNATSVGVCLNGGATGSAANSSAAQTTATYLSVGMGPWAFDHVINGHVRRIRYWPRVLSAAELQSVTT